MKKLKIIKVNCRYVFLSIYNCEMHSYNFHEAIFDKLQAERHEKGNTHQLINKYVDLKKNCKANSLDELVVDVDGVLELLVKALQSDNTHLDGTLEKNNTVTVVDTVNPPNSSSTSALDTSHDILLALVASTTSIRNDLNILKEEILKIPAVIKQLISDFITSQEAKETSKVWKENASEAIEKFFPLQVHSRVGKWF